MRHGIRSVGLRAGALALVLFGAGVANASPIVALEDLRTLATNAGNSLQGQFDSESASPPSPFADWDDDVDASVPGKNAFADQTSSVGPGTLAGTGRASASAGSPLGGASASSSYRIRFRVDTPFDFALTGLLVGSPFVMGGGGSGGSSARLTAPDGTLVFDLVTPFVLTGTPQLTLAQSGLLGPGIYELLVASSGSAGAGLTGGGGYGSASFSFQFSVTAVPEPSGGLLLAAGVVLLATHRPVRRRPPTSR